MNLLKLSRVLPKHIDLTSLLAEAKAQLKNEANYLQEAEFLNAYRANLRNHTRFIAPFVVDELTDENVLTMEYIEGSPIIDISTMSTGVVDLVCTQLMHLTYQELFTHKLLQSDPNFANFLYQSDTKKIVLLDFGACRKISQHTSMHYLAMADAMQCQDINDMRSALYSLGLVDNNMSTEAIETVLKACFEASDCLQSNIGYNLKKQQLIKRIQEISMPLVTDKTAAASPIFEVALVNRKITGIILLANKLGATLDFKIILAPYLMQSTKHKATERWNMRPC